MARAFGSGADVAGAEAGETGAAGEVQKARPGGNDAAVDNVGDNAPTVNQAPKPDWSDFVKSLGMLKPNVQDLAWIAIRNASPRFLFGSAPSPGSRHSAVISVSVMVG
jgi:hypothetical protein